MNEWKSLRERSGLTLAELAEKSGYSIGTINGLELKGEGSQRLKDRLTEILTPLANKESVIQGRSESALPTIAKEDQAEYKTTAEWKTEALKLRRENAMLRLSIQYLAASAAPVSSSDIADAKDFAQEIIDQFAKPNVPPVPPGSKPKY